MKNCTILGGGASGLAAAVAAAKNPENTVIILEKNPRTGKKILASGNGRCNLSNTNISEENYSDGGFFRLWNGKCPPEKVWAFFRGLGLPLSEDAEGRLYPATNTASSVLDVLRLRAAALKAREQTGTEIIKIEKEGEKFLLTDKHGKRHICDKLVVACGSSAGGASVDAGLISSLAALGHKFTPFTPALAPLKTSRNLGALKGVRQKAALTLVCGGTDVKSFSGEVQFRESSLSGIAVLEAAFFWNKYLKEGKGGGASLIMDFLPFMTEAELSAEISRRRCAGYTAENLLTGLASNRLAAFFAKERDGLGALKKCVFPLTGLEGAEAQVCDGGFDTAAVDKNMQSKIHNGLFFTGECLNFAGNCGGYNLHAAWATGITAGEALCGD